MNGYLSDSNTKKIILGSLGTSGILAFINAMRKHYLRLKNRNKKLQLNKAEISSENLSIKDAESSKQKSEVSEEIIQKIVEKIKNSVIHTTCILIDRINHLNKQKKEENNLKSNLIDGEPEHKVIENENKNNDDIVITQEGNENAKPDSDIKNADLAELIATIESKTEFLPEFEKTLFSYNQIRQNEGFMSCKFNTYYINYFNNTHFIILI